MRDSDVTILVCKRLFVCYLCSHAAIHGSETATHAPGAIRCALRASLDMHDTFA